MARISFKDDYESFRFGNALDGEPKARPHYI
jgi:hypothetical protein